MAFQVIARKWRPQRFDDVVGQQAVTRTLRNALSSGHLAQAFVFAGPRGVGKTTTARILARALSCIKGPTADPCGECDACIEIAQGRDMDVIEIDAASHTKVEETRAVILEGLSISPVRNRYKIFIIDEVHQLSGHSFNALLKSMEEPPPHVIFMMATTELDKIPDTVLSRAQVYEFRTISSKAIAEQLRTIVDAEGISVSDDALSLIARDAEGSMRDGQSKLDQVIAFTGQTITADDVSMVLGLVGRDLMLDMLQAVADEQGAAGFALVARAIEMGYDLRAVCRELTRMVRDLLVISVDPSRLSDPEIAGESERDRLKALGRRFSREDLLRAFDLLARTEAEVRTAAQPRYSLEMALLRWMYLRKLTSIEELIAGAPAAASVSNAPRAATGASTPRTLPPPPPAPSRPERAASPLASRAERIAQDRRVEPPPQPRASAPTTVQAGPGTPKPQSSEGGPGTPKPQSGEGGANFKDALLAEIRSAKPAFYNMVVAQAQKIEVAGDRVTFSFSASQRALRDRLETDRAWLETLAQRLAGRRITIAGLQAEAGAAPPAAASNGGAPKPAADKKAALREQALADAGVQTMLEVFPAEIRDVEEM